MITIREATEKDIPRILELYRQLTITTSPTEHNYSADLDVYRRSFAKIESLTGYELLVAEEKSEVVGTIVLIIVPNLSHKALPWAAVENVVVDERYRRQGIGRLLMDYATARAKEAGCYKIQLISDKRRTEAHKFYRTLGYQASGHGFRLYL
jgi:ribosomal protein S18 acetylase RimI-like enzyme